MKIGVREIKNRLSQYLRLVKQGETVIITERNVPVAKIVPYNKAAVDNLMVLKKSGLVSWNGEKPEGLSNPPKIKSNLQVSQMIAEERR